MKILPNTKFEESPYFKSACAQYAAFVCNAYDRIVENEGFGYIPVPEADAPCTLEGITEAFQKARNGAIAGFPVFDGASQTSVFNLASDNYKFRFVHDYHHMLTQFGTNPDDEIKLGRWWTARVKKTTDGCSLAWMIAHAETVGQVLYAQAKGDFPVDQRMFTIPIFNKLLKERNNAN